MNGVNRVRFHMNPCRKSLENHEAYRNHYGGRPFTAKAITNQVKIADGQQWIACDPVQGLIQLQTLTILTDELSFYYMICPKLACIVHCQNQSDSVRHVLKSIVPRLPPLITQLKCAVTLTRQSSCDTSL